MLFFHSFLLNSIGVPCGHCHARRAELLMRLNRPRAALQDCGRALEPSISSRGINRIKISKHTFHTFEPVTFRHWSWTRTLARQRWPRDNACISTANTSQSTEKSSLVFFPCFVTLLYWFILSQKARPTKPGRGPMPSWSTGRQLMLIFRRSSETHEQDGTRWNKLTYGDIPFSESLVQLVHFDFALARNQVAKFVKL